MGRSVDDVPVSAGSEFNPIYEETFENSHELYKQMRQQCPVAHSTAFGGFWALFKFDDVVTVLENSATFITSEKNVVPPATRNQGRRPPLHFDPPEHAIFRRPVNLVFSKGRMTALTGRVRQIADGFLDPLVAQGEFDYTKDFAEYFAAGCFGLILNLPPATMRRAREVQVQYYRSQVAMDRERVVKWSNALYDIAREIVEERKSTLIEPAQDLVSALLLAGERGEPIADDLVVASVRQFLSASQAAPQAVLGSIAVHLARDQDLQGKLRLNPELIPAAVEEFLRLYSPYRVFARTAVHDVEIGGRTIPAGEPITMNFPSANRDEEIFDRPDDFIINRSPNRHIAFGRGPHRCPAAALAGLELQVGTAALLEKTQHFELAGDVVMTDWLEFGPASTPLRVEARS
jgi:cytochrome P450